MSIKSLGVLAAALTALAVPTLTGAGAFADPVPIATPTGAIANGCLHPTTRPQYASHIRVEYAEPFISKAEMDALAKLRDCARTEVDKAWMTAYGKRIHTAYTEKRYMARLWVQCGDSPDTAVKACIRYASLKYDEPYGDMIRVANCESGRNPKSAGHHQGMYQYLFSTWATTPYASKSVYSARWNSLATAWMWSVGRRGEWACQ